jgi:uncharacterized protein DUF1566
MVDPLINERSKTMEQMPKLGMVSMAAVITAWLGVWAPPAFADKKPPAPVPVTGQTECFGVPGNVINCHGNNGIGQDGDIQAGVPFPSPRYVDNRNGTVTDRLTGLIWLRDANCFGGVRQDLALALANNLASGQCDLIDHSKAGDWRLPNIKELQSLIDWGFAHPTLSNAAGTGPFKQGDPFIKLVSAAFYWLSTSDVADSLGDALVMEPDIGGLYRFHKTNRTLMWPVKGGEVREGE